MQTIVFLALLVTIDNHKSLGGNGLIRQLPGLFHLVLVANLIVLQVDVRIRGVVQLHP